MGRKYNFAILKIFFLSKYIKYASTTKKWIAPMSVLENIERITRIEEKIKTSELIFFDSRVFIRIKIFRIKKKNAI